ncbi:hypothetical protein VSS74_23995 [Conexibacter stalactiti]|uniref:Aminoglycoside phosphotransferase domain-containing protein n=1 Tax=Conexibacter stalactiti TaxID=1940611 RepID=A0ABU4HVS2_9ACTN|nr:hypothetical protein [Conexibacter stalactiti]MDW5597432.1 hypothetical protein [Conexibacter stalactiti]MEC5038074.1 hypothetical protein [Conexibacter stalactiti]
MNLADEPHGGSLNTVVYDGDLVVKSYDGILTRGHEKLHREYVYLRSLPLNAARHFATLHTFAEEFDPHVTTLTLKRHAAPSVAKALLDGLLDPERTGRIVDHAARLLLEQVYPIASEPCDAQAVYDRYHAARLGAIDDLASKPGLAPLVTARSITVNGRRCPSMDEIKAWLNDHARGFFTDRRTLVRAHLDPQLDNVLATTTGRLDVIFIDPRGDQLGPPHYDWAKMVKSCRASYHQIHYARFSLDMTEAGGGAAVTLKVAPDIDGHLRAALTHLIGLAPRFAFAEGASLDHFIGSAMVAELVHVLSFCFYHANRPEGINNTRVLAFLAIAALLARRLMSGSADLPSLFQPLIPEA